MKMSYDFYDNSAISDENCAIHVIIQIKQNFYRGGGGGIGGGSGGDGFLLVTPEVGVVYRGYPYSIM